MKPFKFNHLSSFREGVKKISIFLHINYTYIFVYIVYILKYIFIYINCLSVWVCGCICVFMEWVSWLNFRRGIGWLSCFPCKADSDSVLTAGHAISHLTFILFLDIFCDNSCLYCSPISNITFRNSHYFFPSISLQLTEMFLSCISAIHVKFILPEL